MPKALAIRDIDEWDDYLDEIERDVRSRHKAPKKSRTSSVSERPALADTSGARGDFNPTFTGSQHEREWILTYLSPFYQDHIITDVLRVVKGGKEATVYACEAHPSTGFDLLAAKVYRPKQFRTFKNDADYKFGRPMLNGEGQAVRDKRLMKAVAQGSRTGEAASHASWLAHEFTTMRLLHEHGAAVPKPIVQDENAMLMEYFGDEYAPAPTLIETQLPREDALHIFDGLMRNVELMLTHDRIHGDLSAYNVLYWDGKATIIDFPQVIDAYGNPNAFRFLLRDVERLCQYFARYGVRSDAHRIASGMWARAMPDETYQVRGARTKW
jgi:RIO kinase 1